MYVDMMIDKGRRSVENYLNDFNPDFFGSTRNEYEAEINERLDVYMGWN